MGSVESGPNETLLSLGQPRLHSFSEAVDCWLPALSDALPGAIVLGRVEPGEPCCRVVEVRGSAVAGLDRDTVLPLASPASSGELLDRASLVGVRSCLESPLEMSDGRLVGVIAAVHPNPDAYSSEHLALLRVASNLLAYQWENVELRAELRRLRRSASLGPDVDAETGLPDRVGFLSLLEHEWSLANRGTVESVLISLGLDAGPDQDAVNGLAVRIVAEVLQGTIRTTDRVGRVGPATFATVLVGCQPDQAPAFAARFEAALERVTEGRDPQIEISLGVQILSGTASADAALALAEAAGRLSPQEVRVLQPQVRGSE